MKLKAIHTLKKYWLVNSRSQPGAKHKVSWYTDGTWECTCPAYKDCRHIRIIKNKLDEYRQKNNQIL